MIACDGVIYRQEIVEAVVWDSEIYFCSYKLPYKLSKRGMKLIYIYMMYSIKAEKVWGEI